jgi:transposase
MPVCAAIHQELKRHRHVTLQLLWEEYRADHGAAAYSYSEFCTHYRRWKRHAARSMRQRHIAGEKLFIDYAGTKVLIYGAHDEPVSYASVFVAVWGEQLHLRGSHAHADAAGLAGLARSGADRVWRCSGDLRAGQSTRRRH